MDCALGRHGLPVSFVFCFACHAGVGLKFQLAAGLVVLDATLPPLPHTTRLSPPPPPTVHLHLLLALFSLLK